MGKFKELNDDFSNVVRETRENLKQYSPPLSQTDDVDVLKSKLNALLFLRETVTPNVQQKLSQLKDISPKVPAHLHANEAAKHAFDEKLNLQSEFEACQEFLTNSLTFLKDYDTHMTQIRQQSTENSDKLKLFVQSPVNFGTLQQKKERLAKLEELMASVKVSEQNLIHCHRLSEKVKLNKYVEEVSEMNEVLIKQKSELSLIVEKLRLEVAEKTAVSQQMTELLSWMQNIRVTIEQNAQLHGNKDDTLKKVKILQVREDFEF